MEIDTFVEVTRRVIATDGFDDYLPTICYPRRHYMTVIEGIPEGIDIEQAALRMASRKAEAGEEYLVAFKISHDHFKVVRRVGDVTEEGVYPVIDA
ncbi:hypothetical protein TA3x_002144 [Tundrisphaera sp. TA3]|uniref:hypothetical protein n=1 Tax=Tundrisphaera sp. TA3 TaxID=3435775 RepID=UPI003EBC2021